MDVCSSELRLGKPNNQSIHRRRDLDLAGQATVDGAIDDAFEHRLFAQVCGWDTVDPGGVDVPVARGTAAAAATVRHDPRNEMVDRGLHETAPDLFVDVVLLAVVFDEGDFWHGKRGQRSAVSDRRRARKRLQ